MARLHDSRHGSDADGIDDDDMPLTHEQAVVEADAELRRMTYHPVRKAVGIVVAMGVAIGRRWVSGICSAAIRAAS